MRVLLLAGFFALAAALAAPTSVAGVELERVVSLAFLPDTTTRIAFDIPAQPLPDALAAFSLQATVWVEVDRLTASGATSTAVSGTMTSPEALRRLLAGTGMTARFTDDQVALVTRAGDELPLYALSPISVIAERSNGYQTTRTVSATKTDIPLRDAPQSVTILPQTLIRDQAMQGMADVVRYIPGVTMGQGEGHRDAPTIRGNSSTADFFVDGLRDDAQYLRDLYNVERVEALKGSNAMIFGRGGGGGVINRVSKEAQWAPTRGLVLEGGSFDHRRGAIDLGQGFGPGLAARVNAVLDHSDSYRDAYSLERWGVNPAVAAAVGTRSIVRATYERFSDDRTVDRGIPSFQGRPSDAARETFFGNPGVSFSEMDVTQATAGYEYDAGELTVRARGRFADFDKFYQNSYAGSAVNATGTQVGLSAYNNRTDRRNLFGVLDVVREARLGATRHTLLVGAEAGRQISENFRNTGYYNDDATSFTVDFADPTVETPITFRQSATDADNEATVVVAGVYAQDQVELGEHLQLIAGLRFDRFDVDFANHRTDETLQRTDDLVSPRAGVVIKPIEPASLYGSYSISYLPSSGDQFSSLTATSSTLEPERFTNAEVGAKWDVRPDLSVTAAVYRLERTNTSAPDPNNPGVTIQTGEQRTEGVELGVSGNVRSIWQIAGGRPEGSAGPRAAGFALEPPPGDSAARGRGGRAPPSGHVRRRRQHRDAARLHARGRRGVRAAARERQHPAQRRERLRRGVLPDVARQQQHHAGRGTDAAHLADDQPVATAAARRRVRKGCGGDQSPPHPFAIRWARS